ncbi:hypothetical protein Tco_0058023 [Tanacetum coccineum]
MGRVTDDCFNRGRHIGQARPTWSTPLLLLRFTVIKRSRVNDYEHGGNSFNSIEHQIRINDCASTLVNAGMSLEQPTGHVDLSVPSLSKRPRVGHYQRGGNSLGRSQCLMHDNHYRNSLANPQIPTPNSSTHIRCSGTSSLDRPCVDDHQHGTSSSTVGEQSMHTMNNPSILVGVGTAANDCTPPINRSGPPSDYQYVVAMTILPTLPCPILVRRTYQG